MNFKKLFLAAVTLSLLSQSVVKLNAAHAQTEQKKDRIAVMIFAQEGVDERLRVSIEKDLRNMVVSAESSGKLKGRLYPIEPFFDVGQLSKANLRKTQRHFNEAQRAFEKNDFDEARDQLKRAELFYMKSIPFIYNGNEELLQSIYYLNYLVHRELKDTKAMRDLYCNYISLARNITGSVGPIEQFDVLAELCEESPISGTAELKVTSKLDGAHVYINNEPVGLVDQANPYISPFMPAGVHLVEVRKLGYARWGKLVTLENGKSKVMKAKLKRAKNRAKDFLPLANLQVIGDQAFSDTYLSDFFYERTYRFKVNTILVGYLAKASVPDQVQLTLLSFKDEMLGEKLSFQISQEQRHSYFPALAQFWESVFEFKEEPQEMRATQSRWMPTFFKVE
jgi:hypothetical protein